MAVVVAPGILSCRSTSTILVAVRFSQIDYKGSMLIGKGNISAKPLAMERSVPSRGYFSSTLQLERKLLIVGKCRDGLEETTNPSQVITAVQESPQVASSGAFLLITNAIMFAAPLEAMAESCEPNYISLSMPVLLAVALVGATVGGLVARQRKGELQRVNEQLRQINSALRRQAKIESYAPNLSYAPAGRKIEQDVLVDPRQEELISHLKAGKSFLRNQNPQKAAIEFQAALELARTLQDPIREKKAARGLGASLQRQGKYKDAIKYHSMVLDISKRQGDDSGSTEAYGAIADCYTELGDLEQAAKFYDGYIQRLQTD
uniref:Chloroplast FLU-like protein n=1 Tax=Kalanchoe fedtschenkoi TaxID=63787 RepID=A0A7N0VB29_KALFE